MNATPLLEVADLGVRVEGATLLDGVALDVAPQSIHVIVGPNGAGKSTLVGAILGQRAFTGNIRMHWRGTGRIGYVPQVFHADRTLPVTVAEFLALQRQRWPVCFGVRASTRHAVEALLQRVGLGGMGGRRLGVLSGGELRRALIANAIDPAPELLLCDEPASGLDPTAVAALDRLLLELRAAAGTTILLVSHDWQQVQRLADRVTLLDRTVRQTGSAGEIFAAAGLAAFPSSNVEGR
jgi:zinc transport system ATP-binding protein